MTNINNSKKEDLTYDIDEVVKSEMNVDGFKKSLSKALKDPNFDPDSFIEELLD